MKSDFFKKEPYINPTESPKQQSPQIYKSEKIDLSNEIRRMLNDAFLQNIKKIIPTKENIDISYLLIPPLSNKMRNI